MDSLWGRWADCTPGVSVRIPRSRRLSDHETHTFLRDGALLCRNRDGRLQRRHGPTDADPTVTDSALTVGAGTASYTSRTCRQGDQTQRSSPRPDRETRCPMYAARRLAGSMSTVSADRACGRHSGGEAQLGRRLQRNDIDASNRRHGISECRTAMDTTSGPIQDCCRKELPGRCRLSRHRLVRRLLCADDEPGMKVRPMRNPFGAC